VSGGGAHRWGSNLKRIFRQVSRQSAAQFDEPSIGVAALHHPGTSAPVAAPAFPAARPCARGPHGPRLRPAPLRRLRTRPAGLGPSVPPTPLLPRIPLAAEALPPHTNQHLMPAYGPSPQIVPVAPRVFMGKYFGSTVAVKVLEDGAVHKRWGMLLVLALHSARTGRDANQCGCLGGLRTRPHPQWKERRCCAARPVGHWAPLLSHQTRHPARGPWRAAPPCL
jgi:hypothetical protein